MGKLIMFPGVDDIPPPRSELVSRISDLMLDEVRSVFAELDFQLTHIDIWHKEIRDFFWKEEIKITNDEFYSKDLVRWTKHWRAQAREFVASKRIR